MCNSSQKVVPINLEQDCCSFSLCFSLHQLLLQTQKPHPPLFLSLTFFLFITFFSLPSFPLYFFTLHPVVTPRATQGVPTLKKNLIFFLNLLCIGNTLNHKIRDTLKLKKKKKICSTFKPKKKKRKKKEIKSEKKKNCNRAKPMASPIDYRDSKPTESQKKKRKCAWINFLFEFSAGEK